MNVMKYKHGKSPRNHKPMRQKRASAPALIQPLESRLLFASSTPFTGTPVSLPATIMADNFDNGGEGVAYHDTTPGNQGGAYRNTDVDIEVSTDTVPPGLTASSTGVGFDVGHIVPGEWLNFTVNAPTAGSYPLSFRLASGGPNGTFHLNVDGANATGPINFPNTGGWQSWQTISAGTVYLTAGTHVLQTMIDSSSAQELGNVEWFQVGNVQSAGETPFSGTAVTIPGTIPAGNFDNGGENLAYFNPNPGNQGGAYRNTDISIEPATDAVPPGLTATTPGVGYDVGHIRPGEWLNYSINVPDSGVFPIGVRVADAALSGTFHIEIDGTNVTGPMTLPFTGGWQTYMTVTAPSVPISSGNHILRICFDSTNNSYEVGNVEWIQVGSLGSTGPGTLNWTSITPSPEAKEEGSVVVCNNKVYAFGGYTDDQYDSDTQAEVYDPTTNAWTLLAPMPTPVTHAQTVVDGNNIWLISGFFGTEEDGGTNQVYIYNTVTNTYTAGPFLPSNVGAPAVGLLGRYIHVVSGLTEEGDDNFVNTTEHWVLNLDDIAAGWVSDDAAPIPRPRNHSSTVVFNNQMWVIGGQTGKNEFTGDSAAVDVYDPTTNSWYQPGDLPAGRGHLLTSGVTANGTIYLFGGESNGPVYDQDVLRWDAPSHSWLTLPGFELPAPRFALNVGVADGEFIAFGGADPGPLANGWSAPVDGVAAGQTAYLGAPFQVGQTIQADNFDIGGEGVGYHNVEGINQGGQYRSGGVSIENTTDIPGPGQTATSTGAAYDIGHLAAGDWLNYAAVVATTGTYSLDIRVASAAAGGTFHIESDGTNITGPINFPVTGGWQTWTTLTVANVNLTAGSHELKLVFDSSVASEIGNVNWFRFYTPASPVVASPVASPTAQIAITSSIVKPASVLISSAKKKNRPAPRKSAVHSVTHALIKRKSKAVHAHKKISLEGIK